MEALFTGIGLGVIFGIVFLIGAVFVGLEALERWIINNELKAFIITLIIIVIIGIIAYFLIEGEEYLDSIDKFIHFISIMGISVCVSFFIFYMINSIIFRLLGNIFDLDFGLFILFEIIGVFIKWLFGILIEMLLIAGVPSAVIYFLGFHCSKTKSKSAKILCGLSICAVTTICTYVIIYPALNGNHDFYLGFSRFF